MVSYIRYRYISDNLCNFQFTSPNVPGTYCPYRTVRIVPGGRFFTCCAGYAVGGAQLGKMCCIGCRRRKIGCMMSRIGCAMSRISSMMSRIGGMISNRLKEMQDQ